MVGWVCCTILLMLCMPMLLYGKFVWAWHLNGKRVDWEV